MICSYKIKLKDGKELFFETDDKFSEWLATEGTTLVKEYELSIVDSGVSKVDKVKNFINLNDITGNENKDKDNDNFSSKYDLLRKIREGKYETIQSPEIQWFKDTFKDYDVVLKIVSNVINSNAWGRFTTDATYLYNAAASGTAYHEAWHNFTQLFLTKGEKQALYKETRENNTDLSDFTDKEIEEWLADQFMEYAKSNGTIEAPTFRKNIFQKIWDFIRNLFGFRVIDPDYLFKNLYSGNLEIYDFSKSNAIWGNLNSTIQNNGRVILSNEEANLVLNHFDTVLGKYLQQNETFYNQLLNDKEEAEKRFKGDIRDEILKSLFIKDDVNKISVTGHIKDLYNADPEGQYALTANIISKLLSSGNESDFNKVYNTWVQTINQNVNISETFDEEDVYDNEEDSEFEKDEQELMNNKLGEFEQKSLIQTISKESKALIRFLPKIELDESGEALRDESGNFLFKRNEYGFNEPVNFTNFVNTLGFILADSLDFNEMLEKMTSPKNLKVLPELSLLIERLGINKPTSPYKRQLLGSFERDFKRSYVGVFDSSLKSQVEKDGEEERSYLRSFFSEETKQGVEYVKKKFHDNFLSLPDSQYVEKGNDGRKFVSKNLIRLIDGFRSFQGDSVMRRDRFLDIMYYLGFEFSDATISSRDIETLLTRKQDIVDRALLGIKDRLEKGEKFYSPVRDLPKKSSKTNTSQSNFVNLLLQIEENYNPDATSLTYLTAEGSKKYALMNPSYLFTVFNRIKNANKYENVVERPEFLHLENVNSLIINSLFDKSTGFRKQIDDLVKGKVINNLTWGDYNGFKTDVDGKDSKKQTTSLTVREKLIMDMNNLLTHGAIDIMRTEASASSYFYKLDAYVHKLKEPGGERELTVSNLPFNLNLMFDKSKQKLYTSAFISYFEAIYEEEKETGFGILKDIVGDNKELSRIELLNAVNKYFREQVSDFINYAAKNGVDETNFRKYLNRELLSQMDSYNLTFYETMKAFVLNDFILNIEYSKLIAGHPKYYKAYHKRAKTAISTGITLSTSSYVAEALDATQERTMGHAFNGRKPIDLFNYKSKVVKDPKGKISTNLKSLWERFVKFPEKLKPYDDFNPADGQGRITFDFYREFRIRTGTWNNSDEINYVREVVAWKKRKNLPVSKLEEVIIQSFKKEPVVVFPVLKAQYAGVDSKGRPVVHKFSLAPMIPSVIEGTPLDSYNDDLIKSGIGYFTHESGSKVYNESVSEFLGKDGFSFKLNDKGDQDLFSIYLKEQIPPSSEKKTKSNWGTQMRKLFMSNLFNRGKTLEKFKDKRNEYIDVLEYIKDVQRQKLFKKLGIDVENGELFIKDIKPFVDTLLNQFNKRDLPDSIKESIKYDEATGTFEYPLEINLNIQDIKNMLSGMVDREVRRIEVPGDQLVMVSPIGLEDPKNPLKFYEPEVIDGKFVRTKKMEVMIGFSKEYYPLLNLTHPDGKLISTRERLNQAIDNENWRKTYEKELTHVGYRIPTQGINSMDIAIIRKFLPETFYGIVVPQEFVVKTGADYDIDKIFWMRPSYKSNGRVAKFSFNTEEDLKSLKNTTDLSIIRKFIKANSFELENYNLRDIQELELIEDKVDINQIIKDNLALKQFKQDLLSYEVSNNSSKEAIMINTLKLSRDFIQQDLERYKSYKSIISPFYKEKIDELKRNKEEISEEISNLIDKIYKSKDFKEAVNNKLDNLLTFRYPDMYDRNLDVMFQLRSPLNSAINAVVDIYSDVLTSTDVFEQLVTPNSSSKVRRLAIEMMRLKKLNPEIIDLIENNKGFKNTAIFKPESNYRKFDENMFGRKDLGMWAVNNTFSQLLQQEGTGINETYNLPLPDKGVTVKDLRFNQLLLPERQFGNSLSNLETPEGELVQEIISELINATVDIASDPFYSYLGINNENKGVAAFLLQQGVPFERVILFLNQPILEQFYSRRVNTPFIDGYPSARAIALDILMGTETTMNGVPFILNNKFIKKQELIRFYNAMSSNYLGDYGYMTTDDLKERISSRNYEHDYFAKVTLSYFLELKTQADVFRKLQMSNNYDTTKYGTPISSRQSMAMMNFVKETGLFNNIDGINKRSLISIFDNRELVNLIYENVLPLMFDSRIVKYFDTITPQIYTKNDYNKFEKTLSSDFIEFIVKKYGVTDKGENIATYGATLATELEGQPKRLLAERFVELMKDHPELKRFDLFRRISTDFEEKAPFRKNLEISRGLDNTTFTQNLLHEQYNKFLNYDIRTVLGKNMSNEEILRIREFLKDFAYLGFFQSGFNKSKFFFGDIIPNDLLRNRFVEALQVFENQVLISPQKLHIDMESFKSQFIANNPQFFGKNPSQSYRGKSYGLTGLSVKNVEVIVENENKVARFELSGIKVVGDEYVKSFLNLSKKSLPMEFFVPRIDYFPLTGKSFEPDQSTIFKKNSFDYYDLVSNETGEVLIENVELESGQIAINVSENLNIRGSKVKKMPFWLKDQVMAMNSTKAIAAPLPPKNNYESSSMAYVEVLKGKNVLNRNFRASDKVWVFGNLDNYGGITTQDNTDNFNKKYVPLIDEAINSGVTQFNIGLATGIDQLASEYLKSKGFEYQSMGGWNKWTALVTTMSSIDFQEEQSSGYKSRTIKNASADATIALALDFNSAGEKLTKKSVLEQNKKYIPIDVSDNLSEIVFKASTIVNELNSVNAKTLNIAGNGIYTMKGKYTQDQIDKFTYQLLKAVIESPNLKNKIASIRTGGQTGFDEAGAKAGIKLGIPTIILAPKNWTFRNIEGKDISNEEMFKERFKNIINYNSKYDITPEEGTTDKSKCD